MEPGGGAMEQKRILLTVSYDGTAYVGWQYQDNGPSIQDEIEKALQKALGTFVRVTGASRTDAGVHALGQRAHFDTCSSIPPEKYPFVLNRYLPEDIRVTEARQVPEDFHARFQAVGKMYTYRIHNAPHASAILRNCTAHVPVQLDEEAMRRCAQPLIGTHDFIAFCAAGGQAKTSVRTIDFFDVQRQDTEVTLRVHGNGFLYNMCRAMVGTMVYASYGKLSPEEIPDLLAKGDRRLTGPTMPPQGLYLNRVWYEGVVGEMMEK